MSFTIKDVQEKARQEAIRILGDEPKDEMPTLEHLKDVTYINMVIKEVLSTTTHKKEMGSVLTISDLFFN